MKLKWKKSNLLKRHLAHIFSTLAAVVVVSGIQGIQGLKSPKIVNPLTGIERG